MPPISARSRLLAVLGDPVAHSLSPLMQNAAIATLGLEAVYVAFRVPATRLGTVLSAFGTLGVAGNLTVPLKLEAARTIPRLSETARRLQAVNTFWPEDGELHGENTDVAGVLAAVDAVRGEGPWLLVGTGGAARAVAAAVAERGGDVLVRSRDAQRATAFAEWARGTLDAAVRPDNGDPVRTVINATPLGLAPGDPLPVPHDRLGDAEAVLDLVYAAGGTAWVRQAAERGLRAADGREMLLAQGAAAFERFFPGRTAPRAVMRAALTRALEG